MLWLPRRMFGAMVPTEDSETPNRIRVRQLTDKLAMLQDELDNEKEVTLFSHCDADAPTTVIPVDPGLWGRCGRSDPWRSPHGASCGTRQHVGAGWR